MVIDPFDRCRSVFVLKLSWEVWKTFQKKSGRLRYLWLDKSLLVSILNRMDRVAKLLSFVLGEFNAAANGLGLITCSRTLPNTRVDAFANAKVIKE